MAEALWLLADGYAEHGGGIEPLSLDWPSRAAVLLCALCMAGCQSVPAAAPISGAATTVGSTTITTSGAVRVEGAYVGR
jgi:hypothetical protein